jgi:CheY-like chemotaxis protein
MRVMVVEDEEVLLQAISRKLKAKGIEAVTCSSAKQAIDYLKNIDAVPDVIWLDYYLPDMNGLDFVREIKKNEAWKNIPIVVVSNSASEPKRSSMLALGVQKYLLKAENKLEDIVSVINDIVKNNTVSN